MEKQVHEITPIEQPQRSIAVQYSPDNLLAIAIEKGADLDQLERLMALKERHDANEARKAYTEAMSRAKANPPTIRKDKDVSFGNGRTSYSHATLGNVVSQIVPWLASYGFSHGWTTSQNGGLVSITCTLTHRLGHSESVTLEAERDSSGSKNSIQAIGSAKSYLERYTLLAITGLATEEQDDDGGGFAAVAETIAENMIDEFREQLAKITTDEDAAKLWATAGKAILATGNKEAYNQFKGEVVTHRKHLAGGKDA